LYVLTAPRRQPGGEALAKAAKVAARVRRMLRVYMLFGICLFDVCLFEAMWDLKDIYFYGGGNTAKLYDRERVECLATRIAGETGFLAVSRRTDELRDCADVKVPV
jgi:hypothetical protein